MQGSGRTYYPQLANEKQKKQKKKLVQKKSSRKNGFHSDRRCVAYITRKTSLGEYKLLAYIFKHDGHDKKGGHFRARCSLDTVRES